MLKILDIKGEVIGLRFSALSFYCLSHRYSNMLQPAKFPDGTDNAVLIVGGSTVAANS